MVQKFKDLLEKLKWSHVLFIVGGGAAIFFFLQDNSDIESKEGSIVSETQTIANLQHKIQEAKEFEKQFEEKKRKYSELVKSLQNLKEALPRQFFLPDLLSDVLREAKQLEIEVTAIHPDQSENQGELYNSLGFSLETRGSFLQFFIFLDRVAHMSRLVNVETFIVTRDSGHQARLLGGEKGMFAGSSLTGGAQPQTGISVNLRMVTYRYRGAGSTAGAGGEAPVPGGGKK